MRPFGLLPTMCVCIGVANAHLVSAIGAPALDQKIAGRQCSDAVLNSSHHDFDTEPPVRNEICQQERTDGIEIVIHKSTDGVDGSDKWYTKVKPKATAQRLRWGAYHFARKETFETRRNTLGADPEKQARYFVRNVLAEKEPRDKRVLLAFDVEPYCVEWKKQGKERVCVRKEFITLRGAAVAIEEIHRLTGVYPGFYTGKSFVEETIARITDPKALYINEILSKCWLWLARYEREPGPPPKGSPWKNWTMWQYTTNLNELKQMDITPNPHLRHEVAGRSGEFNYIAVPRGESLQNWYLTHSWDYQLRNKLDSNGAAFLGDDDMVALNSSGAEK